MLLNMTVFDNFYTIKIPEYYVGAGFKPAPTNSLCLGVRLF